MELKMITLLVLLTFRDMVVEANKLKHLKIDAMLPGKVEPSADVLLIDNQIMYEFNVETLNLGEAMDSAKYFKEIEFPVHAASFNRRINSQEDNSYVNSIAFAKGERLHISVFKEQLNNTDQILDKVGELGSFFASENKAFVGNVTGMAADLTSISKGIQAFVCNDLGLGTSNFRTSLEDLENTQKLNMPKDEIQGCDALTVVKKNGVNYLLMATEDKLKMFQKVNGKPKEKAEETIDIQKDILGEFNWSIIVIVILVSCIAVVMVSFVVMLGYLVYRRKQRKTVKIITQDMTTTETVISKDDSTKVQEKIAVKRNADKLK